MFKFHPYNLLEFICQVIRTFYFWILFETEYHPALLVSEV